MSQSPQTLPNPSDTPRAPSRAAAILKLILGLVILAAGIYLVSDNLHRTRPGKAESGTVIFLAIVLGLGAALFVAGAIGATGRRFRLLPTLLVLIITGACTFGFLPGMFKSRQAQIEQDAWDRLQASPKTYVDYKNYTDIIDNPRKGVLSAQAIAQTREEIDKPSERWGRVASLRSMLKSHNYQLEKTGEAEFQQAIDLARKALAEDYARALAELSKQTDVASDAEFPADPQMRAAFAKIIQRVATTDDDRVYLDFTSDTQVTAPDHSSEKFLNPGEAFSSENEARRRTAFAKAMSESLKTAFGNESLITFETLPTGAQDAAAAAAERKGKIIFQVKCTTRRTPGGYTLSREGWEDRNLFNFQVTWDSAIIDTDGNTLATNQSRSNPAGKMKFREARDDPFWAPYSVLMDSAYYNYCRELTGRLGLVPPPVETYFTYK